MADDSSDDAVLVVENVTKQFDGITVLDEVSLSVDPGSIVVVVGPNGSGKTTLIRIVTGLLTPSAGRVTRPTAVDRPVGYLPQQPALRGQLTVRETLSFYQSLLDTQVNIDDVLETVALDGVPNRRVEFLSGGMRQLLRLAIATLGDPPLVVLDEPTSGLDPRNTEHIFEIMCDLAQEDRGVLLTSHDLAHVGRADRVAVLDKGQFVVQLAPAEFRNRTNEDSLVGAFRSILGTGPTAQTGEEV